jgi:hypothetical protein
LLFGSRISETNMTRHCHVQWYEQSFLTSELAELAKSIKAWHGALMTQFPDRRVTNPEVYEFLGSLRFSLFRVQ